jgi:hypothetical protein
MASYNPAYHPARLPVINYDEGYFAVYQHDIKYFSCHISHFSFSGPARLYYLLISGYLQRFPP